VKRGKWILTGSSYREEPDKKARKKKKIHKNHAPNRGAGTNGKEKRSPNMGFQKGVLKGINEA